VVARLEGVNDRNAAELLLQVPIEVARDALPDADEGEFYWDELEGLSVVNREGVALGTVSHLFETDAHPILVAVDGETERMIPFVETYIDEVDLDAKKVIVDWQLDW
jgi:16S rRNA processing protein RimM